jgi:hypothetical protein
MISGEITLYRNAPESMVKIVVARPAKSVAHGQGGRSSLYWPAFDQGPIPVLATVKVDRDTKSRDARKSPLREMALNLVPRYLYEPKVT